MNNEKIDFLVENFRKKLLDFDKRSKSYTDGFTYENDFAETMTEVSRLALSALAQDTADFYEEKKALTRYGEIEVGESHVLCPQGDFRFTPAMQNLGLLLGTNDVYAEAGALFEAFLQIKVSHKSVERMCKNYGERLEIKLLQEIETTRQAPAAGENNEDDSLYIAQVDGSYISLRGDEGNREWKETKLARIDVLGGKRPSNYLAYVGAQEEFLRRFEHVCKKLQRIVFIADGAPWFWNWVETHYPEAPQILDFYHAKSHLAEFAYAYWSREPLQGDLWLEEQDLRLKADGVETLLAELKEMAPKKKVVQEIHRKLVGYIEKNKKRMQYKTFSAQGFPIGSGAIESAHREVIQKRMKRAGQRWSKKGAQAMLMLRTMYCGKRWNEVIELIKKNA